jgi:hypothetical protein
VLATADEPAVADVPREELDPEDDELLDDELALDPVVPRVAPLAPPNDVPAVIQFPVRPEERELAVPVVPLEVPERLASPVEPLELPAEESDSPEPLEDSADPREPVDPLDFEPVDELFDPPPSRWPTSVVSPSGSAGPSPHRVSAAARLRVVRASAMRNP